MPGACVPGLGIASEVYQAAKEDAMREAQTLWPKMNESDFRMITKTDYTQGCTLPFENVMVEHPSNEILIVDNAPIDEGVVHIYAELPRRSVFPEPRRSR